MSKELTDYELLKKIRDNMPLGRERTQMSMIMSDHIENAKEQQELTPPTADDVCDLLGNDYIYNGKWFRRKSGLPVIFKQKDGTIKILVDLTAEQLKAVGKFYEGEAQDE